MSVTYRAHGIRFSHPDDWQLVEEHQGDQINITVATPGTAFWTLSLFSGRPDPSDVVEAALAAFREEYDEIDIYPTKLRLCKRPTVSYEIDFECLELLNTAVLHAFRTPRHTILVMYQWTNQETQSVEREFAEMAKSLTCQPKADAAPEEG